MKKQALIKRKASDARLALRFNKSNAKLKAISKSAHTGDQDKLLKHLDSKPRS